MPWSSEGNGGGMAGVMRCSEEYWYACQFMAVRKVGLSLNLTRLRSTMIRSPIPNFTQLLILHVSETKQSNFHERWYKSYLQKVVEQAWVSWELVQWKAQFTAVSKCMYIHTVHIYRVLGVKFNTGNLNIMLQSGRQISGHGLWIRCTLFVL